MIGVVSHLRRQIERDAQSADAVREQVPVPRVGFGGRAEAGVLPHRPEAAAVHGRMNAARERKLAGLAELDRSIPFRETLRRIGTHRRA